MSQTFKKGSFGYDHEFLSKYYNQLITLYSDNGQAAIILSPELQGRVMTSTLEGKSGRSFGWLNYDLIQSGEVLEHFNPVGGEERFWLGPEGGQYSIYFKPEVDFEFENWYVPADIDTEAFNVLEQHEDRVVFQRQMKLENYSKNVFDLDVVREVKLLDEKSIEDFLKVKLNGLDVVGYQTSNSVKNIGSANWEAESGLLSIWLLSMMTPSPGVTVAVPIQAGTLEEKGLAVNDNYFGAISSDRLKNDENTVYFKADGKSRGKIGISPQRATSFMGSYDAANEVVSILEIAEVNANDRYVNSAWELQEDPYSGDALNAYNDGPLEDGSQMGPFYEMESSSPALALKVGESYTHVQRIYHFKGDRDGLNQITQALLKISIEDMEGAF
ncbi:DUF6786 family protein [Membranihabitans marinus]|uniref:DUF6786 family protein n=1 Tax=Membranihabitans marinus TaxID=1227546 RepID=UPI001F24075B|nr:DUF6786 family protein [Membranihabitans marinus]